MLLVQSHIYKIYIRQVDLNRLGLEGFAYLLAAAKGTDTQNRTSYVSYTIHRKFVHSKKLDIGVVFVFVILRVAKRSRRIHDFTGILDPATPRRMTITTCRYTSARTNEISRIGIIEFANRVTKKMWGQDWMIL